MTLKLQDEIRQSKPFRCAEEEAYLSIVRTAAMLEHSLAQALKPFDITPTQYNVLSILRGAGDQGLCRNEVGGRLVTAMPDVTRLLDRMEDVGLIVRQRSTVDRRLVSTRLTKKGLDLVGRVDAKVVEIHEQQFRGVDKRSLKTIIGVLADIREKD
ncbi:MAG TPA: MarR family transcriptional regulator [Vicinamibacterales bacterium]|nr:MarR family transcriptional regulator [Vicinamibacterales bacterium]